MIREPYVGMPIHLGSSPGTMPGRPVPLTRQEERMHREERMRPEENTQPAGRGFDAHLLGSLPLAMAYVPMQQWKTTYSPEQALIRGTVFPELELPFEGRTL